MNLVVVEYERGENPPRGRSRKSRKSPLKRRLVVCWGGYEFGGVFAVPEGHMVSLAAVVFAGFDGYGVEEAFPEINVGVVRVFQVFEALEFFCGEGGEVVVLVCGVDDGCFAVVVYDHPVFGGHAVLEGWRKEGKDVGFWLYMGDEDVVFHAFETDEFLEVVGFVADGAVYGKDVDNRLSLKHVGNFSAVMESKQQETVDDIGFVRGGGHGTAKDHLIGVGGNLLLDGADDAFCFGGVGVYVAIVTEKFKVSYGLDHQADICVPQL